MPVAVTRPSGRRADDVRALRFRFRTLTFSGNYTQATKEVVAAQTVSLKRILGVIPLDLLVKAPAGVTGVFPVFDVSSDGRTLTIGMIEDAAGAAGAPFGQAKTDAEAYIASSKIDVIIVGEG